MVRCFSPAHDDSSPSCSVNLVKGVYSCHGCGIKGNAFTYLVGIRGISREEAGKLLSEKGWNDEGIAKLREDHQQEIDRKQGLPAYVDDVRPYLRSKKGEDVAKLIATHDYKLGDGTLVCRLGRYEKLNKENKGNVPKVLPYTPRGGGGFWNCWPNHTGVPAADKTTELMPLYRLPELLARMQAHPEAQVLVVEGEKCVDALVSAKNPPKGGMLPCTTAPGGSNAKIDKVDWSPLYGHRKLIVADMDQAGRDHAEKVAKYLVTNQQGEVKIVMPLGEGGYDVGDACADGGWPGAMKWIQEHGSQVFAPILKAEHHPKATLEEKALEYSHTDKFRVLGLVGTKSIAIQIFSTYETQVWARTDLNKVAVLNVLAPVDWWREKYRTGHGFNESARADIQSWLLRAAEQKGFLDLSDINGRGAYEANGKYYYNVGQHVLTEGDDGLMTKEQSFAEVDEKFSPGTTIHMTDSNNAQAWAMGMYNAILKYRFTTPDEARAFCGWIVTSLIGGALEFRPMLWLLGPSGTGKTFLLNNILAPMLGNVLYPLADPSEAGTSQLLASSSLPVYIDEFEPKEETRLRFEAILGLIRMCTSGRSQRVRGGAGGLISSISSPRFSMMASSINQANLSDADATRFFPVTLSRTGVKNWPDVRKMIDFSITREKGEVVRTRIIRHTKHIVEHAKEIEAALIQGQMPTREAKLSAALTAGAAFLSGDESIIRRPRLDQSNGNPYGILDEMLNAKLKYAVNEITMAEALRKAYFTEFNTWKATEVDRNDERSLYEIVQRHGFKLARGGRELRIAYTMPPVKELLAKSKFKEINLGHYLASLPGVEIAKRENGDYRKIRYAGTLRAYMSVPYEVLDQLGFLPDLSEAEEDILDAELYTEQ